MRAAGGPLAVSYTHLDVYKRQVFTPDLIALFLSALVLLTRILFLADLMLAKIFTSIFK